MKILHVIPSLGRGGAEQALVNLLPALVARGHTCEVAVMETSEPLGAILKAQGVAVRQVRVGRRWNLVRNVRQLRRFVVAGDYDIVHAHLFFPALYVAMGGGGRAGRVVTFHNMDYDYHPPTTPWLRARRQVHARALRAGVDRFVGVSRPVAEHFERHLGLADVQTVPNAFPADALRAAAAENAGAAAAHGLPEGPFVTVTPGRIVRQKGHPILLDALARLAADGRAFQAWIVGSGPDAEAVRAEIAARGLGGQVTHVEAIPHGDLMAVIAQADAFVMSSLHEGLGLVVGEAMAVGTPVVASAAGGVVDLVRDGETGLLVPTGDASALASAVGRLMDDAGLRARLAAGAGAHLAAEFEAVGVAERLEAIYGQARCARRTDRRSTSRKGRRAS